MSSCRAMSDAGEMPRGRPEVTPEHGLTEAFGAAGVGAWVWYTATGQVSLDDRAMGLLGVNPDTYDGHINTWLTLIHPDDIAPATAEVGEALRTLGPYEVEYRICCPDGASRWVQVLGHVEPDCDGNPYRVLGTVWDSTESHVARDGVRRALRFMRDGFLSVDMDWQITFASVQAELLLNAGQQLAGKVLWDLPLTQVPGLEACCREAADGMRPASFEAEWPGTGRWYLFRFVPVPDGMAWYFTDVTKSYQHRAEQEAAERAAVERAVRIQELTAALAEAVTSQDVVTAVAERVLPPFAASGLFVEVAEAGHLRVIGSVGYPRSLISRMDGWPLQKSRAVAAALHDHRPFFLSSVEEFAERFPGAGLPDLGGKQAWAFLPLVVSGQVVGLCVVSFDQPRHLDSEERALLVALSGLMAQALERARLFDAEHARAQALQRDLLPQVLPSPPAVTAAARYLPAGPGASVGGDWYDVVPLSGDRVALVIGDVMGHGLPEAVIMGRLRTAMQTLCDLDLPPDEIVGHLNDVVRGMSDDSFFATCLYAVYDPVAGICTVARAGHPPPAVVGSDGSVRLAEASADPPLGVAEPPFEVAELAVPDGGLLVFYTDGLIESADVDADTGMNRLAGLLRTHHRENLEQLCDSLTSGLLPADSLRTDDAALLAVRVHAAAPDAVAAWSLPEDPLAAWEARRHVREQLGIWHLDELAADTEILASELVTNVVRHARGPIQLRLLRSQTLICEVFDGSATTPRIRRASWNDEGGRGLQLVTALCDRWGTRYMAEGKCIWTEQSLPLSQLSRPRLPVAGRAARSSAKGNGTDLRGSLPALLGKMWRD
jgi:serine phosphatase RsbU (regulator of sigma subunit)/PAS domain-containing protein